MKVLLVTGTFDNSQGRQSKIGNLIYDQFKLNKTFSVTFFNGGKYELLKDMLNYINNYEVIIWMPNIDNKEEKLLHLIKKNNPHCLLISSKRVVEKDYKESDIIGRLLKFKSGLGIMITKKFDKFNFQLLDPLGNEYINTTDVLYLTNILIERIFEIRSLTRIKSIKIGEERSFSIPIEFLLVVNKFGLKFTEFVNAINPNRFLGNAATRCSYGFPAYRLKQNTYFCPSSKKFVEVLNDETEVKFYGNNKPSVDSPISIRLLNYYKEIKYLIHGHVYIKYAPFTKNKLPCGSIEEFNEIKEIFPNQKLKNFSINLLGHGCLILASEIDYFWDQINKLEERPFPEK